MSEPRTIEEIKSDIRHRVGQRAPFLHADRQYLLFRSTALACLPVRLPRHGRSVRL